MVLASFALTRWFGTFAEPGLEAAFLEDARPRLAQQMRLIAAVQGVLYLAALSYQWQGYGQGGRFWGLLLARAGVALLLLAAAGLARRSSRLASAQWLYFLAGTLLLVDQIAEYHSLGQAAGPFGGSKATFMLMIVLMTYVVAPVPMWMTALSTLLGSILFIAYQAAVSGPWAIATRVVFIYMLLGNGVGYAFRLAWNRISRRDYALRRALEQEVGERQRAEAESRRAYSAKSRFLAVMSHEIRTPLNGVLGAAQLLQETGLRPDQSELVAMLGRSGEQLAALLDDVLDLARIEADHLDLVQKPFDPAELMASVHAVLYPQARAKGLALRVDSPQPAPALVGDALRLQQVLINLAGNAVKFTERGEVVIALALAEGARPRHQRCAFTVRDSGPGLTAEALARVFEPFEQGDMSTRRRHGGAGLGLAISRELVVAMGGDLEVDSAPGRGSCFRVSLDLPVAEAAVAPLAPPQAARPLAILVVDDQGENRIVAQGLLASLGHRARAVSGGAEALRALAEGPFDAVLLDLHMQGMDGLELIRRIRGLADPRSAELPLFLMTADAEQGRIRACLAQGAQGVLAKPIRKARLAALLADLAEPPLVDGAQVAGIVHDLGSGTWQAGLRACRASAEAALAELESPGGPGPALHRLAGLSASYGMPRLHRRVRQAEAGDAGALPDLRALAAASLAELEGAAGN